MAPFSTLISNSPDDTVLYCLLCVSKNVKLIGSILNLPECLGIMRYSKVLLPFAPFALVVTFTVVLGSYVSKSLGNLISKSIE